MWVKLLSVVAEFCFSPFLVTDEETVSDALERSSLSAQDSQQPTSPVSVMEDSSTLEMDKEGEEQTTQDPDLTTEANPQYMGLTRKKSGILLLTLVSFLIFILFIIVQLFIMKLRKAHVTWKKASHPKRCINYITKLYSDAKTKRKENAQQSKLKEKHTHIPESIV
ncbi:cytotoxic and regulatory T-cell molecule isoform 2 precursor [Daubentonia madagascariensis]|uniref:Cytotoxic and regulatory T-cell molecule isoform 2 n=1 Tax=Daubentonia madagascariensis TaxID=31869 RepID=A0ABD2FEF4_DAUMA